MTGDLGSRVVSWAVTDRLLPPEERKHPWWPFRRLNEWTIPGLLIALAALVIYAWQRSPYFLTVNNVVNIGENISIRGLMAIGLTVLLISGGLDLSIAAVAAFSGMFAAMMINAGVNGAVAGLVALACAATMGFINAVIIVRLRVNPIIATLGTLLLFRGLAFVVSGGDNIVIGVNAWSHFGRGEELGVKVTLWVFAAVLVGGMWFMRHSFIGNNLYAIGGNAAACRNVGMKVDRIRMWSYVAMAILSGIAGIALMSRGGTAQPAAFEGAELEIITAVFLGGVALTGGRGSLLGTFLGLIIIGVITNSFVLTNVPIYWQMVVRGIILILAVSIDSIRRGGGYR